MMALFVKFWKLQEVGLSCRKQITGGGLLGVLCLRLLLFPISSPSLLWPEHGSSAAQSWYDVTIKCMEPWNRGLKTLRASFPYVVLSSLLTVVQNLTQKRIVWICPGKASLSLTFSLCGSPFLPTDSLTRAERGFFSQKGMLVWGDFSTSGYSTEFTPDGLKHSCGARFKAVVTNELYRAWCLSFQKYQAELSCSI